MQRIPVDVGRLGVALCVVPPEMRTVRETGEIRRDRDGTPQWVVGLAVRQAEGRRMDVIEVTVPGERPPVIEAGARVVVVGLWAVMWEVGDRHGQSFRADDVRPAADAMKADGARRAGDAPARGKAGDA
jgi:hypothetical protein